MNRRYLFFDNPRQAVYLLIMVLLCIGAVNVYSASYVVTTGMEVSGTYFFFKHLGIGLFGLLVMRGVEALGYKKLLNYRCVLACVLAVVVMLVLVDMFGAATKGAQRWLYIGGVSIQPSEVAKVVVIMMTSRFLGRSLLHGQQISLLSPHTWKCVAVTGLFVALVLLQPDAGTAAIIGGLMVAIYMAAGINMREVLAVLTMGVLAVVAIVIKSPYRLTRAKVWLDPWSDAQNAGYQMVQSLLSIGSGGLTGTNWGHGTAKFFYLPEAHTDFAFAVYCQENGFLGAIFMLALFAMLAGAFLRIVFNAKEPRGYLLAAGVTFLVIGQSVANMAMVCGLLPVIGVPLAFISYGGTSMLVTMGAVGLLLSVYDEETEDEALAAVSPEERRESLRMVNGGRSAR